MNLSTATKRLRYSLLPHGRHHYPSATQQQQQYNRPSPPINPQSTALAEKYTLLLQIIREMRNDIRRSYAGSRTSMENARKRVIRARAIVLQCKDLCSRREYDHCQVLIQHQPSLSTGYSIEQPTYISVE